MIITSERKDMHMCMMCCQKSDSEAFDQGNGVLAYCHMPIC